MISARASTTSGGIAEHAIGRSAPWFILGVMLFSFAVRSIYMESSSMFVRGGVYVVVRDAMGSFVARLSVSALLFDYVLTGPISSVSAGQYLGRLLNEASAALHSPFAIPPNYFAVGFADSRDRLLLVVQHQGPSRVQQQGAEDHAGDHGHGGHVSGLVLGDPARPRPVPDSSGRRRRGI